MREVIETKDAPSGIGPFSQAIRANGFVFVAGQVPVDPQTRAVVAGDVLLQTERVFRNLNAILKAAGSSLDKVVRVGVFLKNLDDFARFNELYASYFPSEPPARTTVEAARLPKDVLVEIDVIALS
ncbi:MAG TPA: RidA family protein [Thermoanaerobaculia bacterium]|nr:RidA family protein [Thermoanaerobaculia bacterium]